LEFGMHDGSLRKENLERVREAERAGQGAFGGLPLRLTVELTADCNLRCPHCEFTPPRAMAEKQGLAPMLHVPLKDLDWLAREVFPHVTEIIPSVVGEPMMYPFWDEFLAHCATHGVFIDVVTNGTYLTPESLARLGPVCSRLRVSMDGASPKTFNVLRAPSDFDDVVGRLRLVAEWRAGLALEERPTVLIESTMMSQWIDELPAMVRLAHELRVDGLGVAHVVAYNEHWERSHMRYQPERCDAMFREAAAEARRLGLTLHLPKLFTTGENLSFEAPPAFPLRAKVEVPEIPKDGRPTFCHYLWREAFISIDGDVAPCCGLGRPVVGNIRANPDLRAIFADPVLVGMREGTIDGNLHSACAKCPQLAMFGDVSYEDASFRGTYAALADHRKKKQERAEKKG